MKLGVNIDHVATIRNARNTSYPELVKAAEIAIDAGADFITVHLREDRRHIRDQDVYDLKNNISTPLNLEISATKEMFDIAKRVKPYSICIVPEKRKELTTEGALNITSMHCELQEIIRDMNNHDIKVSLFLSADTNWLQYIRALEIKPSIIEIHTGDYCHSHSEKEFEAIVNAAKYINELKIECHAGHGITYISAKRIAEIKYISALNVGHYLISEAVLCGLNHSIKKMKTIISS